MEFGHSKLRVRELSQEFHVYSNRDLLSTISARSSRCRDTSGLHFTPDGVSTQTALATLIIFLLTEGDQPLRS